MDLVMVPRLLCALLLGVALLLLPGCGNDGRRSAVQQVAPRGARAVSCGYLGGLVESRSYRCDFRIHAGRTTAALAIARMLARHGFAVSCQEGDALSNDGVDVNSFRRDLRVVAHVVPQRGSTLAVVVYADDASPLWQSLVGDEPGCDPIRVAHLGTAPCISGWNSNARATRLTKRLASRPKVLVRGGRGACSFYFRTRHGLVIVFATWHGERLVLGSQRALDRWDEIERRIYARNPGVRARPDGTLSPPSAAG